MKEKKLPEWLTNRHLYRFFQSKPGRLLSNWILQGMLYMNPVEVAYKIVLDLLLAVPIWLVAFETAALWNILLAFLVAHTINWLINCQPVALIRHLDWGKNNPHAFITHIEGLRERLCRKSFVRACAAYGSLSTGNYTPTSDIDIRIIMQPGTMSQIRAAHFCFLERVRAFIKRFPLDLYAFTMDEVLVKMNPKEPPIIFHDPERILSMAYPSIVDFRSFDTEFRKRLECGDYT
jgi:predicted nucleotidyltransferase